MDGHNSAESAKTTDQIGQTRPKAKMAPRLFGGYPQGIRVKVKEYLAGNDGHPRTGADVSIGISRRSP